MSIWPGNKPKQSARDAAKAALGLEPKHVAAGEAAVAQALETLPKPEIPPKTVAVIPSDPEVYLRHAARVVEKMNAEEAEVQAEIAQAVADHAAKLVALDVRLANIRHTRSFHEQAPAFLLPKPAPASEEPPDTAKVARRRVRKAKADIAVAEATGQGAANA